jgi:hypothetical protein
VATSSADAKAISFEDVALLSRSTSEFAESINIGPYTAKEKL